MEASAAMKVIAVEVAAHLGMSRKAATESQAATGEMASAKVAAHASAAAEPAAYMCAAAAEPPPICAPPLPNPPRVHLPPPPRANASAVSTPVRAAPESPTRSWFYVTWRYSFGRDCRQPYSINSSARASSADGMVKPSDPLLIDESQLRCRS
jgi:hypothetical protein